MRRQVGFCCWAFLQDHSAYDDGSQSFHMLLDFDSHEIPNMMCHNKLLSTHDCCSYMLYKLPTPHNTTVHYPEAKLAAN